MKYEIVFGLVAALCVLGVYSDETTSEASTTSEKATEEEAKGKICEPGALSEVNCNTCICNNAGTELACTKKICVDMKAGEEKPENLPAADGDAEVKPQNLPVPDSDLTKIPETITSQVKDLRRRRRRRDAEEDDSCEPGKNFKRDCNDCVCPDSGKRSEAIACTLIAC